MNLFILDRCPKKAAKYHCDKHINKMLSEASQMLSTAHHYSTLPMVDLEAIRAPTHENHRCTVWVRENAYNYAWAWQLFDALCKEYTRRYGKIHTYDALRNPLKTMPAYMHCNSVDNIKSEMFARCTDFALAMPDEYKQDCPVESYRLYYLNEKNHFAKWRYTATPLWWKRGITNVR